MKRLINSIIKRRFNIILTLYINFKFLPIKQAFKLPIFMFGKWKLRELKGQIAIDSSIQTGMIYMGINIAGFVYARYSSLALFKNSKLLFKGKAYISQGTQLFLYNKALVQIGDNVKLGDSVKIICYKQISIGDLSEVTWESQVTDFNSHFIENLKSNSIANIIKPVVLGKYNWIGNRTSIMPGTKLPDRIIVTSNSLLNKDYINMGIEPYSLLGGMPAKLIATDVKRIYDRDVERSLLEYFSKNDQQYYIANPDK